MLEIILYIRNAVLSALITHLLQILYIFLTDRY
jgi:hypothetical protein